MAFLSLPNEVTIQIIEYLDNQRDINSVCCVNRRFHDLFNEYLFRYNIRLRGCSALFWSAKHGRESTARKLLHLGADVDIKLQKPSACMNPSGGSSSDNAKAQFGVTPLHMAAWYGHLAIVKLLLEVGANPETRTSRGRTPLYAALASRQEKIGRTICRHLSDLHNYVDSGERLTPLHVASRFALPKSTCHFLEEGADIDAMDKRGWTPLHHALEPMNDSAMYRLVNAAIPSPDEVFETVTVLLRSGANPDVETTEESTWSHPITAREVGARHEDQRVRALFQSDTEVFPLNAPKADLLQIGRTWMSPSSSGFGSRDSDEPVLEMQMRNDQPSSSPSSLEFPRRSYLRVQHTDTRKPDVSDTRSFPVLFDIRTSNLQDLQIRPSASPWSPSNIGRLVAGFPAAVEPETLPASKLPAQIDPFPKLSIHGSKNIVNTTASKTWTNFRNPRQDPIVEDVSDNLASSEKTPVPESKRAKARGKGRWQPLKF